MHSTQLSRLATVVRSCFVPALVALAAQAHAAGYTVIDAGLRSSGSGYTSDVYTISGFNNNGVIAESVSSMIYAQLYWNIAAFDTSAMAWLSLSVPRNGPQFATGINQSNQLVGWDTVGGSGSATGDSFVVDVNGYQYVNVPKNYSHPKATGINNSGQLIGTAVDAKGVLRGYVTAAKMGAATAIGIDHYPLAINNKGQVAGYISASAGNTAFRASVLSGVVKFKLPGDVSSTANAINDAGLVAGASVSSQGASRAFVTNSASVAIDLSQLAPAGYVPNSAASINTAGVVVGSGTNSSGGTEPFIYSAGMLTKLNSDASLAGSGWVITDARFINDKGQIAAYATLNGVAHIVVLNPVP